MGIVIGAAIGIGIGAAMHNIGLWITLGAAFGIVFEAAYKHNSPEV